MPSSLELITVFLVVAAVPIRAARDFFLEEAKLSWALKPAMIL